MVSCLHQRKNYIQRKLRVWRDLKCISLVSSKPPLTCAGRVTTPFQMRRYRVDKGNLRKLGRAYRHGTVFAPKEYLYQKEATGIERPKMYFPSRCKNPTHLCGPSKYPVSRGAVWSRQGQLGYIEVDLSPWYRVCTKAIFIPKGSYGYGETGKVFP